MLLDHENRVISGPEPCVFDWEVGMGWAEFRFRSSHDLQIPDGAEAATIAITDDKGRIMWAHPIIGGPIDGPHLLVQADPSRPSITPGQERPSQAG